MSFWNCFDNISSHQQNIFAISQRFDSQHLSLWIGITTEHLLIVGDLNIHVQSWFYRCWLFSFPSNPWIFLNNYTFFCSTYKRRQTKDFIVACIYDTIILHRITKREQLSDYYVVSCKFAWNKPNLHIKENYYQKSMCHNFFDL